jgi:hypothetical protein
MSDMFSATDCDRCNKPLGPARTMSWFTEETICIDCSAAEGEIKQALTAVGKGTLEGCGFVPDMEAIKSC